MSQPFAAPASRGGTLIYMDAEILVSGGQLLPVPERLGVLAQHCRNAHVLLASASRLFDAKS